ncbi:MULTISPECIES: patatin-like phospholipase family protein [unclassified Nocardia]|uniref:patatin-like phospholipase family protein n=1 Tax=unclassified Nocardia TaxID=2637762 RepID=UPI003444E8A5
MEQFPSRALVLGAGGVVGTAWMAGLAAGLREYGIDLAAADLIIGTSAGAIVGAVLASGRNPAGLAEPTRPTATDIQLPQPDPRLIGEVFAVLGDENLEPSERRRRVGQIALAMRAEHESVHVDRMRRLIGTSDWPDRLLVVTVDAASGERTIFDKHGRAPLPDAVVASRAMPGVYSPMTIGDRRFMDGGMYSAVNADLARGAEVVLTIHPLAHLFPTADLDAELRPATSLLISPDKRTINAFGADLHDREHWIPSFRAGFAQADVEAARLQGIWSTPAGRAVH